MGGLLDAVHGLRQFEMIGMQATTAPGISHPRRCRLFPPGSTGLGLPVWGLGWCEAFSSAVGTHVVSEVANIP